MTETNALIGEDTGTSPDDAGVGPREKPRASRMLQQAREAKGLTQKQVAEQLFLTQTFIRYIDDGDFHKIPKAAFIKGYLRSYAKVVGLSGDEVVDAYAEEMGSMAPSPEIGSVTEEAVGPSSFTGPIVQTGVFGLLAVIVVGAIVWLGASDPEVPVVEPVPAIPDTRPREAKAVDAADDVPAIVTESFAEPPVEPASAELRESAPDTTSGSVELPITQPQVSAQLAPADPVRLVRESVEIERVRDGETQYITVYADGDEVLEFSFSDECWVQVQDGAGDLVYQDLNRAGDVMTVYGNAPFEVLLGKAPAVTMFYEGAQVNLARLTTRDQTATVRTARL